MTPLIKDTLWVQVASRWTRMTQMANFKKGPGVNADLSFVMIPGNPGNDRFYEYFGEQLMEVMLGSGYHHRVEFVSVCHLNHVELPPEKRADSNGQYGARYVLQDQIQHKIEFCRAFINIHSKTVLIGHSIGAYIALKVFPQLQKDGYNVLKCVGLFPTLENMATTANGRRMYTALQFFDNHDLLTRAICSWLWLLPTSVKRILVRPFLRGLVPECCVDAATEIVNTNVIRNIIHMSRDELDRILDHDETLFATDREKLLLYYGIIDGWVPGEAPEQQLKRFGDSMVTIDSDNCEHAFVLRHTEVMARNVVHILEKVFLEAKE
uniref:Lipid droplet-associated hydrolase n=1 Tax=Panagrellus redivivus TaxID=6233 RepID=A0A7E4UU59_PANRE